MTFAQAIQVPLTPQDRSGTTPNLALKWVAKSRAAWGFKLGRSRRLHPHRSLG